MNYRKSTNTASPQQKKKIMTLQNDFDYNKQREIQISSNNQQTPGEMQKNAVQQMLNQYFDQVEHSENQPTYNQRQSRNEPQVIKNNNYQYARDSHKMSKNNSAISSSNKKMQLAQNQSQQQKKNGSYSNQYNVYEVKNYEYGEYSPTADEQNSYQDSLEQSYQYNKSNKNAALKSNMAQRSSDMYQEKYLDYPDNTYLQQQQMNKQKNQNKKISSPKNEIASSARQKPVKYDNYIHEGQGNEPNRISGFHKENVHQHSQKKLQNFNQAKEQNVSGIYEKYYQNKSNYQEPSPYSQKYYPDKSQSGFIDSYHNKSSNSQNKYQNDNSDCELSYEDILYQGNESSNEGRHSQNNSTQKYNNHNDNSPSTQDFWKMRKNQHSQNNSMMQQNKYSNNEDQGLSNSFNNTRGRNNMLKSNFVDDQNASYENEYQGRSRSQSQNNYQKSQTHRSPYVNKHEYNNFERSSSFDRNQSNNFQEKPIQQRLQFDGADRSFQQDFKSNNNSYYQEGPHHSRGNSSIPQQQYQQQQSRKQSNIQNQSYSIDNAYQLNQSSHNQSGFANQYQFENNNKKNNSQRLQNIQEQYHQQPNNLQQQYQQQNQQQLFINQLIQNAHNSHQSLENDLQKITDKVQYSKQPQPIQNSKSSSNLQNIAQQSATPVIPTQNQSNSGTLKQNSSDVNNIVAQQNLLIQNLIQQLVQAQTQQMASTFSSTTLSQSQIGNLNLQGLLQPNDASKNQNTQISSNMQQINNLLQQQILQQQQQQIQLQYQQQQQQYQQPQNQNGLNNILQQINPNNQQLLLNLLQYQQQLNPNLQSGLQQSLNSTNVQSELLSQTLPKQLSNPQILNQQEYQSVQSPEKLVEDKLKNISEKQEDMSKRLDQILEYSKKKLNQSLSQKVLQDPSSVSYTGHTGKVIHQNNFEQNQQPQKQQMNQQSQKENKNLLRSKSQLNVNNNSHNDSKQPQNANSQNQLTQQKNFQEFSKIMDDIIKKQEVTIKNLQKERRLSKIAKEQHETSQNSQHQTSTDDLVSKELSEIQHYIKNFQNSYNQIDSSRGPQQKSTKDLLKNVKPGSVQQDRNHKEENQFQFNQTGVSNHILSLPNASIGSSKPNTQRKKWGEESSYMSNKQNQPFNLHEVDTPQQIPKVIRDEDHEINEIKQRFKQDFKNYLQGSNTKRPINNKQDHSPSNQIISQNNDEDYELAQDQKRGANKQNIVSYDSSQMRSPKRWDIPQVKKGTDQFENQQTATPSQTANNYQQTQEKKTPQQWQINWDNDNDQNNGENKGKPKPPPKNLKSSNSRSDLKNNSSPFNKPNVQKKSGLNNIFQQNESTVNNKKERSISQNQENKSSQQQLKQQYQQAKPMTFQYQENYEPSDQQNNIFGGDNDQGQSNNQYQPSNTYDITFENEAHDGVSKSKQSLADIFKSRKHDLVDKLDDQRKRKVREKSVDVSQPSKTKEELAQIRKDLLQQARRRDLSANNIQNGRNQTSMSRGRQDQNNFDVSFEQKNDKNKNMKDPPPDLINRLIYGLKAKVDKKDYKKLTMKNYELLPEIKKKKEDEKKKQEMADRMKHKKEYEQKLRQRMKNVNLNKSQMQQSQMHPYNQQQYNYQQQDYQYYDYN